MSNPSENRSISTFFKPISPPGAKAGSQNQQSSPAAHSTSPWQSPDTPPSKKKKQTEIGASDDEDEDLGSDFSEESLEDLSKLLGKVSRDEKADPKAARPTRYLPHTPKAKRAAANLNSSPLAIMPKHKFDLKALAMDARRDNATQASSIRMKGRTEALKEGMDTPRESTPGSVISSVVNDKGADNAQKIMRAMQRAEQGQSHLRYCFFKEEPECESTKLPREASQVPWKLVMKGDVKTREQHIVSGLPMAVVLKRGGMPESIFDWILDDLCVQKSPLIRQEYCHMLSNCQEQVEAILTPDRILSIFQRLGADESIEMVDSPLDLYRPGDEPYQGRDWSYLRSILQLFSLLADQLPVASAIYTLQVLLRMALDGVFITNIELLPQLEEAIEKLTTAIPYLYWDKFCLDAATLIQTLIKERTIKANSLLCIPISTRRAHDLRRRLAITFLFNDANLARQHPEDTMTLQRAIDHLQRPEFRIGHNTDFADLRSAILMLDMALDDGSVKTFDDVEDEKQFNKLADELAELLQGIWGNINDSGMKLTRTEAKSVVEWVKQRLLNSIRTRKKMKESIFDIPGQAEDEYLPRQQDFMMSFLKPKKKAPSANSDTIVVGTD